LGSGGKTVRKKALGLENPALIFMGEMMAVRTWSAILVFGNAFFAAFLYRGKSRMLARRKMMEFLRNATFICNIKMK
jgi:hypothetical protein